jgi:hypothetical protein
LQWLKNCCGRVQDKNEPSLREQLSLNDDERSRGIKEFIEGQTEENQQERTSEDHYAIDLKETEEGGLEEFQTHIQIPPKGNN